MEQNFRSKHITDQLISCRDAGGRSYRLQLGAVGLRCTALLALGLGAEAQRLQLWNIRRLAQRGTSGRELGERERALERQPLECIAGVPPAARCPWPPFASSHSATTRGRACVGRVDGSWAVFLPWTVSKPAQVCRVFVSHTKFLTTTSSLPDPCSAYSIRPIRID
jgi:hypothetical protein